MNPSTPILAARLLKSFPALALVAVLAACSSGTPRPKPAELAPNAALIGVRQAWTARVGEVGFPLSIGVSGNTVVVAGTDGTVAAIDGRTGRDIWRGSAGAPLLAGVGTDGRLAAVVTNANEVVALDAGREVWRQKLSSQAYTAPFVAGGRVFVLAGDRSVTALDGQTGRRLWQQQRPRRAAGAAPVRRDAGSG